MFGLKSGLREVNTHYLRYPEEERRRGIMRFARRPPIEGDFFISKLYDKHIPSWREKGRVSSKDEATQQGAPVAELSEFVNAPRLKSEEVNFDTQNPDFLAIQRLVKKRKGLGCNCLKI